jgi:hypothetical protein
MKLYKDQATVHAMLNGWALVTYQTDFDGAPGYGFHSQDRHEWIRTQSASMPITRATIQSRHMTEVSPDTVPEAIFWRLFNRLLLLELVPKIPKYRNPDRSCGFDDEYI